MNPQSAFKPFLWEDGSFRFLDEPEFANLSTAQRTEYLVRASRELKKTVDELRRNIAKRDREAGPFPAPARTDDK